jgi:hypothetical protein
MPPSSYHPREHYEQTFGVTTSTSTSLSTAKLTESLPDFLTDYVHWHARVRSSDILKDSINMNTTTRILLVSIGGQHVGGLADRLRSLPYLLWEAQRTDRLFLMEWTNPCAMQEFLLPPLGGIDWTVPTHWKEQQQQQQPSNNNILWYDYDAQDNIPIASTANATLSQAPVLMVRHSPFTFMTGIPLLMKKLNVTTWTDPPIILSRIFQLLLTLSPPVQRSMDETMKRLNLIPNHFDAIHLRAHYPGAISIDSMMMTMKLSLFSRLRCRWLSMDPQRARHHPGAHDYRSGLPPLTTTATTAATTTQGCIIIDLCYYLLCLRHEGGRETCDIVIIIIIIVVIMEWDEYGWIGDLLQIASFELQ